MTNDAWKRQRELKKQFKEDDVPDTHELVNIINSLSGKNEVRDRALFAMYYLTACRCSEITRYPFLKHTKYKKENDKWISVEITKEPHEYMGIKKQDITFDIVDGLECMNIRTENRKNKERTTKKQPIPISKEQDIVKFVKNYLETIDNDTILFPFLPIRATQIINKVGWNIHFIRHIRATHLVTKYDFNTQLLVKFMGWTNAMPAKNYMELSSKDMFRQFYKSDR